mmetsp:Transcript_3772/g.6447  ORF Transcript_3772/g.6447 Transcript_3772/m.6447 type:complete len:111 (-) Transcript_3772:46-378(-)
MCVYEHAILHTSAAFNAALQHFLCLFVSRQREREIPSSPPHKHNWCACIHVQQNIPSRFIHEMQTMPTNHRRIPSLPSSSVACAFVLICCSSIPTYYTHVTYKYSQCFLQ